MISSASASFAIPRPIPGENQSIPIVGSTVKIKGLTDQTNQVFISGRQSEVGQDGGFYEEIIVPLGLTEILIEVRDPQGLVNRYSKNITAKENHYFLAGIADGTLNWVDASENFQLKRDNTAFDHGHHANGKISYYFAGKVKGKYLIKSSLDTDKATQEKLFTNIDPDKYYPALRGLQNRLHGCVHFFAHKIAAVFNHYHGAVIQVAYPLALLLTLLDDADIHFLSRHNHRA